MIKTLHDGEFLKLLRDGHWEYVTRQNASGAVFVVAVTLQDELLLVEQTRIPMQARTIELPAGIMGDSAQHAAESAEQSALRELLEETGYQGHSAHLLCAGPIAAGLTSEVSYYVQVEGLRRVHDGGGVEGENIHVHSVPLAQIEPWLQARRAEGLWVDPKIYIALHFIRRSKR